MSAREQHLATRRAAGLFDFSFMGLYEFSGTEGLARVQTRELSVIARGQAAYTLLLNDDGSVFNDATVWNLGDGRWWLFTGRPSDFGWISARVNCRDRSGEHAILALQGPLSGRILARLVGEELVRQLKYFRFVESGGMLIARLGYSGELGYELLVSDAEEERLRTTLLNLGHAERLCECSFEAANSLRIESCYVLFDREIDGKANPRELGLERLVSSVRRKFDAVRKLVALEIEDKPPRADLPIAQATSECRSPILKRTIGLGFADPEVTTGSTVALADGRTARVARLPFYDPERRRPRTVPIQQDTTLHGRLTELEARLVTEKMYAAATQHSGRKPTVEDMIRGRGLDPQLVKFGRLVGPGSDDPLRMTLEDFDRAAIGGRALDAADLWFTALEQQYRRSSTPLPWDANLRDVLSHMADAELSLVPLLRLRRAAVLFSKHVEGCEGLEHAIHAFDASVPHLKHLRDTQEHFDDYILGNGRHKPRKDSGGRYEYSSTGSPPVIYRGQRSVDLGIALKAARELYGQIYHAIGRQPHLYKDETVQPAVVSPTEPAREETGQSAVATPKGPSQRS